VIDDTAGHPDTLRAVLASIDPIARSGLRILFGLRGSRGVEINERLAATMAELVGERAREESVKLVITSSEDTALERDRVAPEEREAAIRALDGRLERLSHTAHVRPVYEPTLAGAIEELLAGARPDELILLLGAQGMDRAAELASQWFEGHDASRFQRQT
jgi:UDP-N-acetylmuramoyl-L-alanyl-D-glutamate--2,6-diaminopimelate ligase